VRRGHLADTEPSHCPLVEYAAAFIEGCESGPLIKPPLVGDAGSVPDIRGTPGEMGGRVGGSRGSVVHRPTDAGASLSRALLKSSALGLLSGRLTVDRNRNGDRLGLVVSEDPGEFVSVVDSEFGVGGGEVVVDGSD
jgi:hypothetical protein